MAGKGLTFLGSPKVKSLIKVLKDVKLAFNPAAITSPNFNDTTLTVAGAGVGDQVEVVPMGAVPAGGLVWGFVSAADTVTIRFFGIAAAGSVDWAPQDFTVYVYRETRL